MVEDLLGSAAALRGMARHEELGLLSAAQASLPLAGSALPASRSHGASSSNSGFKGQLQFCSVSSSLGYKLMEQFLSGLKDDGTHTLTTNLHETSAYIPLGEASHRLSSETHLARRSSAIFRSDKGYRNS
ncbi:uncharacterized protein LOC144374063 [Ictidomys tridecemlineatus]